MAIFAASFIYLRDWIYPAYIIHAVYTYPVDYPWIKVTMGSLVGLALLHLFWTVLILRVLFNAVFKGKRSDVRED